MRLAYVKFKAIEKFTDGTSSDEIASDAHGEMHLDGMLVRVGVDIIPVSHVRLMREMSKEQQGGETCPECKGWFMDPRALGAHRAHKHNVQGARSKGKTDV